MKRMNAVIYLDVPDWQIGQDVSIYFPDTMVKHCKCELLKEQEAVVRCKDCISFYKNDNMFNTNAQKGMRCKASSIDPDWFCADGVKKDG